MTAEDGLELLKRLKKKIPKKEVEKRARQFQKAKDFIHRGQKAGGLDPHKKTFKKKGTNARVDIEILGGKAFVSLLFIIIVVFWILKQLAA